MALHITKWEPDTCDCILEYEFDDTIPEDQRTHSVYNVIRSCTAHQGLGTFQNIFNTVIEENPRKNNTLKHILDSAPASIYDLDQQNNKLFKKGIELTNQWSGIAPNRVLTVTLTGITLTTNQKNAVQNYINTKFGTGKVVLVNG